MKKKLEVFQRLGGYCIAYEDQSKIILDGFYLKSDAVLVKEAIENGTLLINENKIR